MLLEYELKLFLNFRCFDQLAKRLLSKQADNMLDKRRVFFAFDHLHKLQCRRPQLDTLCGRFVKRAVDDVRPFDQLGKRAIFETKFFFCDACDEFRTGRAFCIKKFLP